MTPQPGAPDACASGTTAIVPGAIDIAAIMAELDALGSDPKTAPILPVQKRPKTLVQRILSGEFDRQGPVADTPPSFPTPTNHQTPDIRPYHPRCAWTYTTPAEKFDAAYHLAGNRKGIAFTINFDAKRRKAILASADPARYVSRHIHRALAKHFTTVPQFAFAFEIDRRGKLHLHGAMIPPSEQSLADPTFKSALRSALKHVGGKVIGYASGRPVDVKAMFDAGGWCEYSLKDQGRVRRFLDTGKTMFISAGLRRAARDFHDKARAAIKRK